MQIVQLNMKFICSDTIIFIKLDVWLVNKNVLRNEKVLSKGLFTLNVELLISQLFGGKAVISTVSVILYLVLKHKTFKVLHDKNLRKLKRNLSFRMRSKSSKSITCVKKFNVIFNLFSRKIVTIVFHKNKIKCCRLHKN